MAPNTENKEEPQVQPLDAAIVEYIPKKFRGKATTIKDAGISVIGGGRADIHIFEFCIIDLF